MIERAILDFGINALWQLPLLAVGAWLLVRLSDPQPVVEHRLWLAVLLLTLVLPAARFDRASAAIGASTEVILPAAPSGTPSRARPDSPPESSMGLSMAAPSPAPGRTEPVGRSSLRSEDETPPARVRRVLLATQVWLTPALAQWLTALYALALAIGLLRLGYAWRASRKIVRHARPLALSPQLQAALQVARQGVLVPLPELRESDEVSGPALVGVVRPVLVLPPGFANLAMEDTLAALHHELAHLGRRDCLTNLLCQCAALPLFWHPVIHLVARRIRSSREMACDAIAADAMHSERQYAQCLLSLAQRMLMLRGGLPQAMSLFGNDTLEERVMRLVHVHPAISLRLRLLRAAGGASLLAAALAVAVMGHLATFIAGAQAATAPTPAKSSQTSPGNIAPTAKGNPPVQGTTGPGSRRSRRTRKHTSQSSHGNEATESLATGHEDAGASSFQSFHDDRSERLGRQIARAMAILDSPEYRRQMADAQGRFAEQMAKLNSPAFEQAMSDVQKQVGEAMAKLNSPEYKQQIADARRKMEEAQREVAEASARLNSPEFRQQVEDAQRQVDEAMRAFDSPEYKQKMEALRRLLSSGEFQKKLDESLEGLTDRKAHPDD